MKVSVSKNTVMFFTKFNDKYSLAQKFRGVHASDTYNSPFDFAEAGLVRNDKWDICHSDTLLSVSTDGATPSRINGEWIGANHGQSDAVLLYIENHGKTFHDIGSRWKDENGTTFTLLRVENEDYLLFISDNIGADENNYEFVRTINGSLTCLSDGCNTADINDTTQQRNAYLSPAVRYIEKKIYALTDGVKKRIIAYEECDTAQLIEAYEIINPATVAPELTLKRPENGYDSNQNLAEYGKPMLYHRIIYHILEDGTVLCDFEYKKMSDVNYELCLGVMFQEKIDVYGGGIFRYLPKTLPFSENGVEFNFSVPRQIFPAAYPQNFNVTKEYWSDAMSPPDRVVDYFRDENGSNRLAFTCGFLPVYDGEPHIRRSSLNHAVHMYRTRKYYPHFMDGGIDGARGIAYKKFFECDNNDNSIYTVDFGGKRYYYADFFSQSSIKTRINENFELIEKSDNISYEYNNGEILIHGDGGYAVFAHNI